WALLKPHADRLISTDNTHIDGEFLGLSEGQVRLKSSLGVFASPVDEVTAVIMNSELADAAPLKGAYLLVSLRDGSRVSLTSLQSNAEEGLSGSTVWGAELAISLDRVARVQFFGSRVVALSDMAPADYVFTPYLTQEYPLVANRNVHGGRLRLRGQLFAAGLGVSSKSEVTYDLEEGNYANFEAVVGVDDMTEGQGNVVFAVEVDGQRVFESAPLDGRSPQKAIGPLDVRSARRLKLIVDFGQFGNIQDVADWCDPVLVKPRNERR
ncbi:MAG: NPCBM/NEW2 domain-containing protein, partial [Planctomycetaceae bacterium]